MKKTCCKLSPERSARSSTDHAQDTACCDGTKSVLAVWILLLFVMLPLPVAGDEAQQLRRLPDSIVERLVDEGFFRFALPEEVGGEDASSLDTIEILEAIAAIDASVSWNVMLGSEINAMAVGGMDKELAKEVYIDNPRVIMCGGGGPDTQPPRAERVEGGIKVWGQSTFISGCHNATWCFMAATDEG